MTKRKLTEQEKAEKAFNNQVNQIKSGMERDLSNLREDRIPEPAYIHFVGDRVTYGRWDWNALPYKIEFSEKLKENEDIRLNFQQRHLSHLLRLMFSKYGIDLNPDYQRGNVWTLDQKISLIDSIFKNIDIGKFTVIKRLCGPNPNKPITDLLYEVLDGKQRLTAIYEFYIGKFQYKGKYFYELHPMDRYHLIEYNISYAESEQLTNEQKYRYFLKLNATGVPMDKEHIEKVKQMWLKEKERKL